MAYLPDEAVERSHELTGGAFKLYAYLCKLRNNKTGICWPRGRTAAAELHVDHSRIVRWRKELIDLGWIEFERPTSVTRPLIGFPSHGAKNAPEVMSKAHHAGAETAPPHGTKSAPRNCGKRTAHIRTEPAHEPAHEEISVVVSSPSAREGATTTTTLLNFPRKKPEPLTDAQFEREVAVLEAKHPTKNVRHVREKMRLAGGEQTLYRLTRWVEMEHVSPELPAAQACVAKAVPKAGCRFCDGSGWQPIHDGTRGRVVECECNGSSAYQEPAWLRRLDGRWERSNALKIAEC